MPTPEFQTLIERLVTLSFYIHSHDPATIFQTLIERLVTEVSMVSWMSATWISNPYRKTSNVDMFHPIRHSESISNPYRKTSNDATKTASSIYTPYFKPL